MSDERAVRIETILKEAFEPDELLVKDQTHLHAGHVGAKDGGGHFDVKIVAEAFRNCSRIQTHQMIYAALADMMSTEIHALSIRASAK